MVPAGSHCAAGFHLGFFICCSTGELMMQPSNGAPLQHDEVRYIPTSDSQYKKRLSTHAVRTVWWKLEWYQDCGATHTSG